jgi:hypothetical protein
MGRPTDISPEDFVRIWQTARTRQEASEKTGLSPSSASARASYYRSQKGIPLRRFTRGTSGIDWSSLVALARSLEETT